MKYFDTEKAIEAILYISHKQDDLLHIMKALFFADKMHLAKHGRSITGDVYIAMPHGHVPSGAFDIVKYVRGDGIYPIEAPVEEAFDVINNDEIKPKRDPNLEYLSESDIESLEFGIAFVEKKSINELSELCKKEPSYSKAGLDGKIPFKELVLSLENGEEILEYVAG
ncbi:MAG: Panacea domain-containing protein [Anaerolineales bacterium]